VSLRVVPEEPTQKRTIEFRSARTEVRCDTPCDLQLPSGLVHASVKGERGFEQELVLPREPVLAVLKEKRRTQELLGRHLAALFALLGVSTGVAGGALWISGCPSERWRTLSILSVSSLGLAAAALVVSAASRKDRLLLRPAPPRAGGVRLTRVGVAPLQGGSGILATAALSL
jgi:hypothetical protein